MTPQRARTGRAPPPPPNYKKQVIYKLKDTMSHTTIHVPPPAQGEQSVRRQRAPPDWELLVYGLQPATTSHFQSPARRADVVKLPPKTERKASKRCTRSSNQIMSLHRAERMRQEPQNIQQGVSSWAQCPRLIWLSTERRRGRSLLPPPPVRAVCVYSECSQCWLRVRTPS